MKILSVSLENFASYKKLSFDFQSQGLTLIQGANGSGKSTLCDVIPWALFGFAAKGGSVSEILSWPGDQVTKVTLQLENVTIVRTRGPKPKDNDLYWTDSANSVSFRGKDLLDTQRLINGLLGIDYDLYLAGSYFHEFSQTAQFFTTTAKNRRVICEQLVDLSLPVKLQEGITATNKAHNKLLLELKSEVNTLYSGIEMLTRLQTAESTKASAWDVNHKREIDYITGYRDRFEKKRDSTIYDSCSECGTEFSAPKHVYDDSINPYIERLEQLAAQVNPHSGATKDYTAEIEEKRLELANLENEILGVYTIIGDLDALSQICDDFRSVRIQNTIKFVETKTNQLLTDYFDAEIRVEFEAASNDKLEVSIYKDGNICSFTQLSKGQRGLLKLCFGVSVMEAVQNHHGISFNCAMFDEALDGMADAFKLKAYRLFESLQYESVFVVEHSEALKACFENSYTVTLTSEGSVLAKT